MTSLTPTVADRNREAAAVNLVARHLAERGAKHITARLAGGLLVWSVESQTEPDKTYTVTREIDGWPADTCSCPDYAYRHMACKHQRAVNLVMSPAPAPAATEWTPRGGWLSDQPRRRTAWREEV